MTTSTPLSRRERLRESTLREIAEAGRAQLQVSGPQGLTLSAVARQLGMTAPALYRYVDGVSGLLTLLVTEAYSSLAVALETARDAVGADDFGGRFLAVAEALRSWARSDPAQYGLLFGSPVHGSVAPEDGPATAGGQRAVGVVWSILLDAQAAGRLGEPPIREVEPAALALLQHEPDSPGPAGLAPATQAAAWAALSLLLGAVAMEVFGHMPPSDEDTSAAMFRDKAKVALHLLGLPDPR